jgi:hypothetical protein
LGSNLSRGSKINRTRRDLLCLAGAVVAVTTAAELSSSEAHAASLPSNFQESAPISGHTNPTVVRFSQAAASSSPREAG